MVRFVKRKGNQRKSGGNKKSLSRNNVELDISVLMTFFIHRIIFQSSIENDKPTAVIFRPSFSDPSSDIFLPLSLALELKISVFIFD